METLEHTASIVWKALQLGNLNVLPEYERDRLMSLRERFNLPGRVATCDATPMPSNEAPFIPAAKLEVSAGKNISEKAIREITEKVLSKIKAG